jgi:hypothetical protein
MDKVAVLLGVSKRTVQTYSPPSRELRNRPPTARNDWLVEHDEYADVVPIPFYPPDLPELRFKPLTAVQLAYVFAEQRRILYSVAAA